MRHVNVMDMNVSDDAIAQINSLGGAELPSGVSVAELRVILENRRAADSPFGDLVSAAGLEG